MKSSLNVKGYFYPKMVQSGGLPKVYGPLYGPALKIALVIILIVTGIFLLKKYKASRPLPAPAPIPPLIPRKVIIRSDLICFKPFLKEYRPSSYTQNFIEIQTVDYNNCDTVAAIFQILPLEILSKIFGRLSEQDIQNLSITSRFSRNLVPQAISHLLHGRYTSRLVGEYPTATTESRFPTTPANYQFLLFLRLCQHFYGLGNIINPYDSREGSSPTIPTAVERQGFIAYLIRRLGPFTFLTIPHVTHFQPSPTAPIEYCSIEGRLQFRFSFKRRDSEEYYIQEIAQQQDGYWKTSNQNGFWPMGETLTENHVYQLLAFLRNESFGTNRAVGLPCDLSSNHEFVPLQLALPPSSQDSQLNPN